MPAPRRLGVSVVLISLTTELPLQGRTWEL